MSERGKIFNTAPVTAPNKSSFDMSSDNLLSCSAGTIVPHNVIECMPGDNIKQRTNVFGRVAPMLAPTFGKCDVMTYDFYVRYRDIWPDFDEFITNQSQDDSVIDNSFVAPLMPQVSVRQLLMPYDFVKGVAGLLEDQEDGTFKPISYNNPIIRVRIDTVNKSISTEYIYPYDVVDMYDGQPSIPFGDEEEGMFSLYISLLPNRGDMLRIDDYMNTQHMSVTEDIKLTKLYYNHLSDGDLAELLGIDMTAFYVKQLDTYLDNLETAINDMRTSYTHNEALSVLRNNYQILLDAIGDRVIQCWSWKYSTHFDFQVGINAVEDGETQSVANTIKSNILDFYDSIDYNVSLLPFFAYNFIYDEYFRDQNYISKSIAKQLASGALSLSNFRSAANNYQYVEPFYEFFSLRRKAYMHDPYTSALPNAQRGEPVRFLTDASLKFGTPNDPETGYFTSLSVGRSGTGGTTEINGFAVSPGGAASTSSMRPVDVSVDLSAATIENFRWANSMQRYLEAVNRTGGRYFEYMLGIFGESIPDSKINRPIYINGNRTPVQISEVLQTSQTDVRSYQPLGDMAGRGIVVGNDESIDYDVNDFGVYLQLAVVVPRTSYMTGLNPMFTRETYLDYPIPQFAQLGEEYVRTSELWFDGTEEITAKPFGYQSRYYQWKYKRDEVHSDFKRSLDFWHWSRKFSSEPINGQKFLEIDPDYRQFAITDKGFDHYYLYFEHNVEMLRPLPTFGVPTL